MSIHPKNYKMYDKLADWWPLVSAPEEYREEADAFRAVLLANVEGPLTSLVEFGSGGGSNACHLKKHFQLTLVDPSSGMLEVSRALNPECEHQEGDMRTARLERLFDAVFLHDALDYIQTEEDLERTIATAWIHCRPGGVALFVPDHIKETFEESTEHGGHTKGDRALRFLEWTYDPDPDDDSYVADYAFILREGKAEPEVVLDRHLFGLFRRATWLGLMEAAGFQAEELSVEATPSPLFLAKKPKD